MDNNRRRVVITGMGAITPLGMTIDEYWGSLVAGKSGIAPGVLCDYSEYPCQIAGEVTDFDAADFMDRRESRRIARFSQMAVAAAGLAIENGGLDLSREDPERLGVVMGNGNGGFPVTEGERADHDAARRNAGEPVLHPHDFAEHGGCEREPAGTA